MAERGILSPPRSASSYKKTLQPEPPPKYMLPLFRRPAADPNEHRNRTKQTHRNHAKANAVRIRKAPGNPAGDKKPSSPRSAPGNAAQEQEQDTAYPNDSLNRAVSDSTVFAKMKSTHRNQMERRNSDGVDYAGKALIYGDRTVVQSPGKKFGATPSQTLLPLPDNTNNFDSDNSAHEAGSETAAATRLIQIYRDIASRRQGTLSVTCYFTNLEMLWDELSSISGVSNCSCGEHGRRQKVMQFLMGLNDSYSTLCGEILLMNPFPTIEMAFSLILREEKQRELIESLAVVTGRLMHSSWHNKDESGLKNRVSINQTPDLLDEVPEELYQQKATDSL